MSSRWVDSTADQAEDAKRKAEKNEKKRQKALKQAEKEQALKESIHENGRPLKRRRLSSNRDEPVSAADAKTRRVPAPTWQPCRSVEKFNLLNPIEEGSYGSVSRAREESTGKIVAIKRLKMEPLRDGGFPVTALREVQCLALADHRHVVKLQEVVFGEGSAKDNVYLVMDFVEHDLKTLQEDMVNPFTHSEVKTLMLQLGSAVEFLHDHCILHRDLKTSNILMNNQGEIKLADFGMARLCGDPAPRNLTQLVVTLWYRSPELLLGATTYGSSVDVWSIGCIFGELLAKTAILQGKNELDQLSKIFELCGTPDDESWPEYKRLPNAKQLRLANKTSRVGDLQKRFSELTHAGLSLLETLLSLDPDRRPSARDMLDHPYFSELPRPKPTAMFPTFPSKAGQVKRRKNHSPDAPRRGDATGLDEAAHASALAMNQH